MNHLTLDTKLLLKTIKLLCSKSKGILSADEDTNSINKRFAIIKIENTKLNRREWRKLLFNTENLEKYISGVIVCEEALHDTIYDISAAKDVSLVQVLHDKEILIGIKTDQGLVDLLFTEKWTRGLDTLRERSILAFKNGARFSNWRCVYTVHFKDVTSVTPSTLCVCENARVLAMFARISQECGLVPIIEPELLMDGEHTIDQKKQTQKRVLQVIFDTLKEYSVWLPGVILKTNFVVPSTSTLQKMDMHNGKSFVGFTKAIKETYDVCNATLDVFNECVPQSIPAVFFLDKGLSEESATTLLLKINDLNCERKISKQQPIQQYLSFGFAIFDIILREWGGKFENLVGAQHTLLEICKANSQAICREN